MWLSWNSTLRESGLGGEPASLIQLLGGEVDAVDPAGRTDQTGGVEGVHPGPAAEVDHPLTGPEVSQVEEVAHPGEGLHGPGGHLREPVGVVPHAQRDRCTELEVELVLRPLGDVPIHVLDLGLELPGVHRDRHRPHLSPGYSMDVLNKTPAVVALSREILNTRGGGDEMAKRGAKAALYDALAESAKALANGRRAELVDVLAQGERSVEELAVEIDQTVANTSQHLQRLLRSGLVESRREGTRIYYSLSSAVVGDLWRTMRRAAQEHVAGLEQLAADYLGDRSRLRTITRDDLRARLRDGDVVVLDVRPEAEYTAGHIRGAVSIPIQNLKSRLGDIPDGAEVVAYCRGPYCVYADEAVRMLSRKGVTAARLEDGFPEWAEARLPVARR
jgi:rhodanese-related sulfurtransferase